MLFSFNRACRPLASTEYNLSTISSTLNTTFAVIYLFSKRRNGYIFVNTVCCCCWVCVRVWCCIYREIILSPPPHEHSRMIHSWETTFHLGYFQLKSTCSFSAVESYWSSLQREHGMLDPDNHSQFACNANKTFSLSFSRCIPFLNSQSSIIPCSPISPMLLYVFIGFFLSSYPSSFSSYPKIRKVRCAAIIRT